MCKPKLVRPKALDPGASRAVKQQVQQKNFSMKPFLPGERNQQKNREDSDIPERFIEKGRMNLNISHPIDRIRMLLHQLCDLVCPDGIHWKTHCKKAVRILTKCLSVKKIPPSSDDLPQYHTGTCRIQHERKTEPPHPCIDDNRQHARDHRAVQRKSSAPEV